MTSKIMTLNESHQMHKQTNALVNFIWFIYTLFTLPSTMVRRRAYDKYKKSIKELLQEASYEIVHFTPIKGLDFAGHLSDPRFDHIRSMAESGELYSLYVNSEVPRHMFIKVNEAFTQLPERHQHRITASLLATSGVYEDLVCINTTRDQVILALKQLVQITYMRHQRPSLSR